jgi:UDP-3-O-[3-hydroxymyristoyl] glucosamine N-acyltransferase
VRIDDFTIITAEEEVAIGSYVHIGAQVFIAGRKGLQISDFVNISAGSRSSPSATISPARASSAR